MDANVFVQVRTLHTHGVARDLELHRLIDRVAAADAEDALRRAAVGARRRGDLVADVLARASGGAEDLLAAASPEFLALLPEWIHELRELAATRPDTGACTLATAFQLWRWTLHHFTTGPAAREAWAPRVAAELVDALSPLVAARALALETAAVTRPDRDLATDVCHAYAAHAASALAGTCAELVFGYRRHLVWDAEGCASCFKADELDDLEGWMPGIASAARGRDVIEADGSHPIKAGPCVRFDGVESFTRLRAQLDGCLSGARLAKERAAATLVALAADANGAPSLTGGR